MREIPPAERGGCLMAEKKSRNLCEVAGLVLALLAAFARLLRAVADLVRAFK